MSNQYTPGPWRADGNNIRSADDKWGVCLITGTRTVGASLQAMKVRERENAINEANARLIAEAPAMMEALERFVANDLSDDRVRYGLLTQARAIIQRVRGES